MVSAIIQIGQSFQVQAIVYAHQFGVGVVSEGVPQHKHIEKLAGSSEGGSILVFFDGTLLFDCFHDWYADLLIESSRSNILITLILTQRPVKLIKFMPHWIG